MKKLFAILLVLTLLVPMALTPVAKADVAAKPYYLLGWSDYDNAKFPYLEGLASSGIKNIGDKVILYYGSASMMYGSYTDEDVTAFAQAMKKEMESRPVGMRYWHFYGPAIAMKLAPKYEVYLDHGVDQLKELCTAALKKMQEIGCPLEGIVVDTEYIGMGSWYLQDNANKDPLFYNKIVSDPRYATEIRPLLVERGFRFYEPVSEYTPEIYSINHNLGDTYADSRDVWNTVMRLRLMGYLNEWCYEPLHTYYPDATMSDYQSTDTVAWIKGVADDGSVVGAVAGNTSKGGNTSNYNFYANRPSSPFYTDGKQPVFKNPPTYNEAVYEASAYNMFRYDMNLAKRMYVSTDTKLLSFWLCEHDYDTEQKGTVSNTPYYAEEILHLGLYDPQPFLGYIYSGAFLDANGKPDQAAYEKRLYPLNELMAELTRVAGYADRKPIELPMAWNSEFMLTGMYVNGRNLWRITPNTELVSKENFKIEGTDPTFYVAGQKITFPGGKIIEDGNISVTGTCGYWVETAKDVTPIVVNDADRLEKTPAYVEDFESYEVGTKLTSMNIREQGAWSIVSKGSDLVVEADGSNKVLAVTGNSSLQNNMLPANVTIADSYAKNQIWELTVTVPAGMTAEEALILLNFGASGQKAADGGFKVSGGKVYYSDNGEYKELALDLSAGGKYTFKRQLDFNSFTCDYTVLDASGKEAAAVKGAAIPAFKGKVASLKITCENIKGKVLLDNYTLRATGVAADFEVYDAATGLKLAQNAQNAAATAYRLSWTNIDAADKQAKVIAAYYEGDTLKEEKVIKEVKLTRGGDGVEYGVLDVPAGQSVKISMQADLSGSAAPDAPNTPNATNPANPTQTQPAGQTGDQGGISPLMIVLIVVVVLAVAGVVLVLVLTKKKK